jgi:hypothetical protein
MWVAMRSRNQRSWLMTTAQPAKVERASSRARSVSTSRSLVGSSSRRTLPPSLSSLGQVDAVALAAGEHADLLLLVGALEVEGGDVGAAVDLALAELEVVGAAGDLLVDGAVASRRRGTGRRRTSLTVSPIRCAAVGLLLAGDHAEQGGLAGAVGADDADDAGRGQREAEVLDEEPVAEALGDVLELDDGGRRGGGRAGS